MNIAIGHDFCCVWELNVGPLQDAAAAAAHAKDKLIETGGDSCFQTRADIACLLCKPILGAISNM